MPIYEFYCSKCNTIFNFLSRRVSPSGAPACPKCGGSKMTREVSAFAMTGRNGGEKDGPGADLPIDEKKMENAMMSLASEAEHIDENNPAQAAKLMRKFSHMTGIEFKEGMEQAIQRMEAGENPEAIEKEMEGMMGGDEDPFVLPGQKGKAKARRLPPSRDQKLYEM